MWKVWVGLLCLLCGACATVPCQEGGGKEDAFLEIIDASYPPGEDAEVFCLYPDEGGRHCFGEAGELRVEFVRLGRLTMLSFSSGVYHLRYYVNGKITVVLSREEGDGTFKRRDPNARDNAQYLRWARWVNTQALTIQRKGDELSPLEL